MNPLFILIGGLFAFVLFIAIIKKAVKLALTVTVVLGVILLINSIFRPNTFERFKDTLDNNKLRIEDKNSIKSK